MKPFLFLLVLACAGPPAMEGQDLGFLAQRGGGPGNQRYEQGQKALDARRWDEALADFSAVAAEGGARADGALYWKAYALNKLGRREQALGTIDELRKNYASSKWLDDAKALELEVRQAAGQKVNPDAEPDEDLKLMAVNSLLNSDPERALPVLERILNSAGSPRLKERALFVLAQSSSPKAREILTRIARGSSNPDLQLKAVNYLGVMGNAENRKLLGLIYTSSTDARVKRAVLQAYLVAGDRQDLLGLARNEKDPALRKDAIHALGISGGQAELWQLYQAEPSVEVKEKILQSMFVGGNADKLVEVARTEKDPRLRRAAIHSLGIMGPKTGAALLSLFASETAPEVRRSILNGLFMQGNAKALVDLARKESDPKKKQEIVQKLSLMGNNKDATDYLMELLK
ncbi:MAG TPA: HEAT repeat domain-containing protein [Bryobacteraceae bacterium]|nr:HEAT repeat domain-containing protein [Bryobacteraceae bacterium]